MFLPNHLAIYDHILPIRRWKSHNTPSETTEHQKPKQSYNRGKRRKEAWFSKNANIFYERIITDVSLQNFRRNVGKYLSTAGQATWHFWWTVCHCDTFYSQNFGFSPLSTIPPTPHTASIVSRRRDAISAINSVANNTFKRTTSYSRRSESSSALLWGPYTSQRMRFLHAKCLFHGEFNYDSHSSFITSPTTSLIH
jgi:hypothetical protein